MSMLGRPARFDGDQQAKRALLAKIHVAAKQLGLNEDQYRQAVFEATGQWASGDCTEAQLRSLVARFERMGFKALPARSGQRRAADHPSARKARALWISLHQLGAIDNPSEKALEAFAARQLKVTALQWANQAASYKLIEALKAMAERHGWSQDTAGAKGEAAVRKLKVGLLGAILAKLQARGLAGKDWSIETAAARLTGFDIDECGLFRLSLEQMDEIATALGGKLRGEGL